MPPTSYQSLQARIVSRLVILGCGVSAFGLGTITLVGYALDRVGLYQWGVAVVGMAPNTAIGFLLTGFGVALLAASNRMWRCS